MEKQIHGLENDKGCKGTHHATCDTGTPTKIIIYCLIKIHFNERYLVFYLPVLFTGGSKDGCLHF